MKKTVYLWLVKLISWFAQFRQTDTIIYLMSFADNLDFIEQLHQTVGDRLVVYYLSSAQSGAAQLLPADITIRPFHDSIRFAMTGVPVLTCAADIYCDNYYAFTAGLKRRQGQRIIQLWHASGAVKAFGWHDPATLKRSPADQKRFQAVYDQITDYVVGSTKMGQVFAANYHVPQQRMRVLGYPRSDRYCQSAWVSATRQAIFQQHPALRDREVVLYAPTYRAGVTFDLPADFATLKLKATQVLVIKLHPHLAAQAQQLYQRYPNLITLVPEFSTDELLTVTTTLISDYSSVIFDYALLPNCQKIILFTFDWASYRRAVGLQADFKQWAPGPFVTTTAELNQELATPAKANQLTSFNQLWNTQNDGQATKRTLAYFYPQSR
ncbi:CDP-glycerol glycerophosphotransferase family protein [Lactiplantibacillus sp. WILCCON 0030]|uniref:CDP-glycerol glycerophosphotransferase family protein n=1 Tax=Lactiplantibacillus brownii TaxID=3069269 RepID=A0ABU1A915_9LACO|nr:CDP-glycerol glycerophosphotransferase family protein [Lactiplantibacillus brownii]MDQ7937476.1 CDP-glycerol glycerophosphotransferase family protein [Lactiplantibacillus brownii]